MRAPNERSLEIAKALEGGASQRSLIKQGYPASTVRYYHLKINRPKAFDRRLKLNKKLLKQKSKLGEKE